MHWCLYSRVETGLVIVAGFVLATVLFGALYDSNMFVPGAIEWLKMALSAAVVIKQFFTNT